MYLNVVLNTNQGCQVDRLVGKVKVSLLNLYSAFLP